MGILQITQAEGLGDVEATRGGDTATLDQLKRGKRAQIAGFHNIDQPITQRLMQLGLIRGENVEVLRTAPGGDPVEYQVMGYSLSLRRAEAKEILIRDC